MDPWQKEELKERSAAGILWAMQVLPYARTIAAFVEARGLPHFWLVTII